MRLNVQFTEPSDFIVEFATNADFSVDIGQLTIASTVPTYEGITTVTPKIYDDIHLKSKGKMMPDDVTVLKIPRYEVSNDCGGVTLIMGDEYFNG